MKANHGARALIFPVSLGVLALVSGCSQQRVIPAPTPTPTAAPALPPPAPAPRADWRQMPATPGDWTWAMEGAQSVARFAGGALVLRCDRQAGAVTLQRAGSAAGPAPLTILTSSSTRTLTATPEAGPPAMLSVRFAARDPMLDAMAFSKGRFAIETTGSPTLYVPSWTEVSRVIEDCR